MSKDGMSVGNVGSLAGVSRFIVRHAALKLGVEFGRVRTGSKVELIVPAESVDAVLAAIRRRKPLRMGRGRDPDSRRKRKGQGFGEWDVDYSPPAPETHPVGPAVLVPEFVVREMHRRRAKLRAAGAVVFGAAV